MKKVLALMLSVLLLMAVFPLGTFAAENDIVSVTVDPITLIENADGWEQTSDIWDGDEIVGTTEWFQYNVRPEYIYIEFANGDTAEGDYYEIDEQYGSEYGCWYYSNQGYDNQWGVGEYTATFNIGDYYVDYTVIIEETPIESMTVDTLTVIKDVKVIEDEYYIYEDEELVDTVKWYRYDVWPENVTVELKNGDIIEGNPSEVAEQLDCNYNLWHDQEYDNQWGVGEHTAYFKLMGFETEFTVEIIESPVEYMTVAGSTCIEGVDGNLMEEDIWEDDEFIGTEEWFEYYYYPNDITLKLKDGRTFKGDLYELYEELEDEPGCWYSYGSDQSYENQWDVGEHTAYLNFMGFVAEYTIEVVENPVESITADDISRIVGTNMISAQEEIWNEETEDYEWVGYSIYNVQPEYITVKLKNGETVEGDIWEVCDALDCYDYNYYSDQDYDNEWDIGTHTATFEFMGVKTEYSVEITESPVNSITVEDVSHIVGTGGEVIGENLWNEETEDYDYVQWYEYNVRPEYFTVELEDGEIVEGDYWEVCDELGYEGDYESNQSYGNQWYIGTHTATFNFMGYTTDFNVIITESPVASIEIEDLEIIEGSHSYHSNDGYYEIYYYDLEGTITFTDGTTQPANQSVIIDDEWYEVSVRLHNQVSEPWEVGNTYEASAILFDTSTTFNVTVTPTPIKSFTLEDIILYQGIDSEYYGGDEYYYFDSVLTRVVLEDGTNGVIKNNELVYDGDNYWVYFEWEMQYQEPLEVGNTYEATGYLLGKEATFNVTIKANPIKELQLIKAPTNTVVLEGSSLNFKGAVIRIKYTDGTYEDITINHDFTDAYYKFVTSKKIDRTSRMWGYTYYDDSYAEVELFGKTCEIPITVKENLMEEISIREDADKSIIITVTNSDNTTYDIKVLDLAYCWQMEDGVYYASLLTDKGSFRAYIYANENSFSMKLIDYEDEEKATSNVIGASKWFEVSYYLNQHPLYWMAYFNDVKDYNGVITAENIDQVLQLAVRLSDIEIDSDYVVVSGDEIRDIVAEYFAIDDIDLTLSENYDEEKDEYLWIDMSRGGGETGKERPDEISYADGIWNVTTYPDLEDKSFTFKLNDDLQTLGYSVNNTKAELRTENGVTYYYEDGVKSTKTGIVELDGKQIYINKGRFLGSSGLVTIDGKKMYINKGYFTGATGLVTISGKKTYINKGYFTGASGLVTLNGKKMYINKGYFTGASGLVTISGKKMYINKGYFTGSSGLVTISGKKMYINKGYFTGASGLVTISGKKMYINKGYFTGATGIVKIGSKRYYINKGYFLGKSGTVTVGGKKYKVVKGIVQ